MMITDRRPAFTPNIAPIAALIGDPARAAMLMALMSGKALTVSELGGVAGLTKASASAHLSQMEAGGLLASRRSGRHKYLSLASARVAGVIEAMMGLANAGAAIWSDPQTGPRSPVLREARLCYDHLAGRAGVQVYDSLSARGFLTQEAAGLGLTEAGRDFLAGLGVDLSRKAPSRAPLCRACLDWSERKTHLSGHAGRALLSMMLGQGWFLRADGQRALASTPKGAQAIARHFPPLAPG
jgi:DNA-binding transcriptional ArsR family regulator